MKRKPIKVDWDELESAFENKREDLVYYLDLVTGQVVLDGEGEEDDFEDDEDDIEEGDAGARSKSTRLYIEPPTADEELAWMEDFVDQDGTLAPPERDALNAALESGDPDTFRDALRTQAEARARWFLFRSDRLHESIDAWLDANNVHSTDNPPWR